MLDYKRNSEFGPGHRVPMSRSEKQLWLAEIGKHRHVNGISVSGLRLAEVLASFHGSDGRLDLCHDVMAANVGCTTVTIKRQLRRIRNLGLIAWVNRITRGADGVKQTSNAYVLILPAPSSHQSREQNDPQERPNLKLTSCTSPIENVARAKHESQADCKIKSQGRSHLRQTSEIGGLINLAQDPGSYEKRLRRSSPELRVRPSGAFETAEAI